jgi:hypothetical protein
MGWRSALLVLAVIVAVICVPLHAFVVRLPRPTDRAADPARQPEGRARAEVLRSGSFRWLVAALAVLTAGRIALSVHLVAYLVDRGYTLGQAALAAGGIGLMQVAGRGIATALGQRRDDYAVYAGIFVLQGASLALPLLTTGHGTGATVAIGLFIALYGLGFGLPELIRGVTVADFYGTRSYASINGVLGLFVTIARAAGPGAAGVAVTLLDGYAVVLAGAGVAALAGAVALVAAARAQAREAERLWPAPAV